HHERDILPVLSFPTRRSSDLDPAIDEGWTRWVFDTWKVPYVSLVDSVVRAGKLRDRFDAIVLPDQSRHALLEGLPLNYPPPYPGDRKSTRLNSSHVAISYAVF